MLGGIQRPFGAAVPSQTRPLKHRCPRGHSRQCRQLLLKKNAGNRLCREIGHSGRFRNAGWVGLKTSTSKRQLCTPPPVCGGLVLEPPLLTVLSQSSRMLTGRSLGAGCGWPQSKRSRESSPWCPVGKRTHGCAYFVKSKSPEMSLRAEKRFMYIDRCAFYFYFRRGGGGNYKTINIG